MKDPLIFIQFIAQFAVIGGLIVLVRALLEQRKLSAVNAVPTVDISDVGERSLRCVIKGSAEPRPGGLLTGPMSGRPCVWFQATIQETWRTVEKDEGREISTTHTSTRWNVCSAPQLYVRDPTGLAVVNVDGTAVDEPVRSHLVTMPAVEAQHIEVPGKPIVLDKRKLDHTVTWREVIVPPGQPMYVLGVGRRHPETGHAVMSKPGRGPFIVSTLSEEELRERSSERTRSRYIGGGSLFVVGVTVFTIIELTSG
ncbi:hypothetical protein IHE55_27075 [Streptomyces pactum]|uniref:RING-type E3 ubiquitin transferase n=1 Tax=Streptomyces pactum TaxID=68249 RepID=A0ABS0NSQ5_9ACTN|nr:GIDE domain-containing protein [Streptomyces pactum]MBH5338250.1 hypothetical protein [Streptomyces pactum]